MMIAIYRFKRKSGRQAQETRSDSLEGACRKLGITLAEWNLVDVQRERIQASQYPRRCLNCGGLTYLDEEGEPKCLMCAGDPTVKRTLPDKSGVRTFSNKAYEDIPGKGRHSKRGF